MNKEALTTLDSFTGTEQWYSHGPLFRNLLYTDGVKHLVDNADCYWLLDIIGSFQPTAKKDPMLRDMQFWHLKRFDWSDSDAGSAKLTPPKGVIEYIQAGKRPAARVTCDRDSGNTAIVQDIAYTDFPFDWLPEVKLYVQRNVMEDGREVMIVCLPSEY